MISILLATCQGERYIKQSIDSILNQTYDKFELLIGLNGENTITKSILYEYNDNRLKVLDYGNEIGKSITLNKLLNLAKYDWLAIQDDDDIWDSKKLEKQITLTDEYDVIGTKIKYISETNQIIGEPNLAINHDDIIKNSLNGINNIANTSAIFKKECALEINGWATNLDGIEDFDFWLKLIRNGRKFINLNEVLVLHRLHSRSNFNTKKHNLLTIL